MNRKGAVWVAGVLLVVGVAAAWAWAKWALTDRVAGLAQDVHGIGVERGMNSIPNEERVAEQVRQLAAARGLEVAELDVSIEELSDDNMDRAGFVTREIDDKLQKAAGQEPSAVPRRGGPEVELEGALVEVRAIVTGDKWLWSVEDEIEVSKVLGRRAEVSR